MRQSMEQQDQKAGTDQKRQINKNVYVKYNAKNHGNDEKVRKGIRFLGLAMLLAGTLFPRLFFLDCVHAVMPEAAAGAESSAADPDQDSQEAGKGTEKGTEESAQNQPRELTGEDYERLFDPERDEYRISFWFLDR